MVFKATSWILVGLKNPTGSHEYFFYYNRNFIKIKLFFYRNRNLVKYKK